MLDTTVRKIPMNVARIRTSSRVAALSLLLAVGGPSCARQEVVAPSAADDHRAPTSGSAAFDFSARDIEGKNVALSSYLGKSVVLLSFCATWCDPCIAEFPHLRRIYETNAAKGFVILAIAMDGPETVANVPAFARRNQLSFPVLSDEDSHIASLYNPKKVAPFSVLIDRSGKIVSMREGYNPGDEEFLAQDVARAVGATDRR
jgi:peroxiredoxin